MNTADMKFVFYDRSDRADDNAEFLCRWVMKNHPEIKCQFLIKDGCGDWDRLKAEGFKLINIKNKAAVKKALDNCTHIIYSQFTLDLSNYHHKYLIFLQHGILFENFAWYINPHIKDFDIMCTTTTDEYQMCHTYPYKVPASKLALTGLARHDSLVNKKNKAPITKTIVVQPHWRNYLEKHDEDVLKHSKFFQGWIKLMNSKSLYELSKKYGYSIKFRLHPMCRWCQQLFKDNLPDYVEFIDPNSNFQNTFVEASLYVTDFSSNAFEVATIDTPCIYYQPDYDEICGIMEESDDKRRMYDYKTGIGPVSYTIPEFIRIIKTVFDQHGQLDQLYQDRRSYKFKFKNSKQNCLRIFNAIIELSKTQKKIKSQKPAKAGICGKTGYFLTF